MKHKRQPHPSSCPLTNFMEYGTLSPQLYLRVTAASPSQHKTQRKSNQTGKGKGFKFGYLKRLKLHKQKQGTGAVTHCQGKSRKDFVGSGVVRRKGGKKKRSFLQRARIRWVMAETRKDSPPSQGVRHTIPFTGMGSPGTAEVSRQHGLRGALLMPQYAGDLGTRGQTAGRGGGREPPGSSERAMSTGRGRITPESAHGKGCALRTRRKIEQPMSGKQVCSGPVTDGAGEGIHPFPGIKPHIPPPSHHRT